MCQCVVCAERDEGECPYCAQKCGCGGHDDIHVCPVCGMTVTDEEPCGCSVLEETPARRYPRPSPRTLAVFAVVAGVDLTLKTIAIRRALKKGDRQWVLPLALSNTLGVLPSIYLCRTT